MKTFAGPWPFLLLFFLSSCETFQQEEEVVCLPTNMTATIIQGIESDKIIADFHYVEGTPMLDHITWSNHQTHIFGYDEADRLLVVRQVLVKEKLQKEMWFEYDGELVNRVVLVDKNLDYTFLEPIDSSYTGHIGYEYEGKEIKTEQRYEVPEGGGSEVLVRSVEYDHDTQGNITTATTYLADGSSSTVTYTYDTGKHPFSGLQYYFSGESFMNNMLSRSESAGNRDYTYDIDQNAQGYATIIYEKLGSVHTRITRYSYMCN